MTCPPKLLATRGVRKPDPWKCRCARVALGLTQHELAARMGYAKTGNVVVSQLESYLIPIGERRLERLAKALRRRGADLTSPNADWHANKALFNAWRCSGWELTAWLEMQCRTLLD